MMYWIDALACRWLRWRQTRAVLSDPTLASFRVLSATLHMEDGATAKILLEAPSLIVLAEEAVALLRAYNAPNYVQFDMLPRLETPPRPVRITVQWADGESPARKAARLEAALLEAEHRMCQEAHR